MRDEVQKTHYEGCWRDHHDCAVLEYARSVVRSLEGKTEEDRLRVSLNAIRSIYKETREGKLNKYLFMDAVGEILSLEEK